MVIRYPETVIRDKCHSCSKPDDASWRNNCKPRLLAPLRGAKQEQVKIAGDLDATDIQDEDEPEKLASDEQLLVSELQLHCKNSKSKALLDYMSPKTRQAGLDSDGRIVKLRKSAQQRTPVMFSSPQTWRSHQKANSLENFEKIRFPSTQQRLDAH